MNLLEISVEKLCGALGSDFERGLTSEQAERNYKEFKGNSVNTNQRSFKDFFGAIFGDSIMLLFVVISLVAVFLTPTPSVVWTLIVSVFACIFFHIFSYIYVKCVNKKTDVYKTNKYKVKRDGVVISIDGDKIVPGDIIIINRGDVMPCDGVILKRKTLRVLESHVT